MEKSSLLRCKFHVEINIEIVISVPCSIYLACLRQQLLQFFACLRLSSLLTQVTQILTQLSCNSQSSLKIGQWVKLSLRLNERSKLYEPCR